MNFVSHLKDIQDKLFNKSRYGGCYIYSRHKDDTAFKLGMSEVNLFGRVKQAKSCFPLKDEFFIHMYIICHDIKQIRPLEKKLLAESKELKKIKVLTDLGILEQGIRSTEYRLTTNRSTLGIAVKNVLNDNRLLWDEVIVFGENGWSIYKKSIKSLAVSTSKSMFGIQYHSILKVGDDVYVIFGDDDGKAVISTKGKITKKFKYKFQIHWKEYKGSSYTGKYNFNEVYKTKKEANIAKNFWYS
jgi:hypothetical protein